MIPLTYMMSLSAMIFAIGVAGVIIRRNILVMLMSIELMLNAVNLAFIAIGSRLGSMDGQVIVFFVMTVAAAEAAVGLGHHHLDFPQSRNCARRRPDAHEMVTT